MKKYIQLIVFLLIGLGLIWWFIEKLTPKEIEELINSFSNANYFWFIVAILLNIFSSLIRAIRWKQLLEPMRYKPKLISTFFAVQSGYLANLALPRLGEVIKCGLMRKKQNIPIEKSIGTIITERAVDLICFLLILIIALSLEFSYIKDYIYDNYNNIFDFEKIKILFIIGTIAIIVFFFLLFIFRERLKKIPFYNKVKEIIDGFLEGIKSIGKLKKPYLFIFNSLLIWFIWILGTFVIFLSITQTSTLSFKIAIIATVLGAVGPMIIPGGIGIYPVIISQVLLLYNIEQPIGYASGWLLWTSSQIGILLLGLIGFIYFSKSRQNSLKKDS
ncbi:MAG: flippase-like domain-containing protein [Bacteroidales bacterium]|jgi:uncharacterized protein (TIRG00374 family)|nr:flippase-like domain-containing protein [Bacteroidales bacterium]